MCKFGFLLLAYMIYTMHGRSCGAIRQYRGIFWKVVKPTIRHGKGWEQRYWRLLVLITDNENKKEGGIFSTL
jgi:hypothetical protein